MKRYLHRGSFFAWALLAPAAFVSHAATTITHRSTPTPGMRNHVTVTLTAASDAGSYVGFNFSAANNSGYGFTGPLNQRNPFGVSVIFDDYSPIVIEDWGILADTHFLVKSKDGLVVAAAESSSLLSGAYNTISNNAIPQPFDFVQLVIPIGQTVAYRGAFTMKNGPQPAFLEDVAGTITIPEPSTVILAFVGLLGLAAPHGRRHCMNDQSSRHPILAALLIAAGLMLSHSAQTQAATILTSNSHPTPGLAGFTTYTLTAMSDAGDIIGFNFAGANESGLGFYGPMNHRLTRFGAPIIFRDADLCPICSSGSSTPELDQDSHFLVRAIRGLTIGAIEGPATLQAAWNMTMVEEATTTLPFAQLVIPDGILVQYNGDFTLETANGYRLERVAGTIGVPEPAAIVLFFASVVSCFLFRRTQRCSIAKCMR